MTIKGKRQKKKSPPVETIWIDDCVRILNSLFERNRKVSYRSLNSTHSQRGYIIEEGTKDYLVRKLETTRQFILACNPDDMVGIIKELAEGDADKAKEMAKKFLGK